MKLPPQVLRWVSAGAVPGLVAALNSRDWVSVFCSAPAGYGLSLCTELVGCYLVPRDAAPKLLGIAIAHAPRDERVNALLVCLRASGQRVYDGDLRSWRRAFDSLPEVLTIYRGVSHRERAPAYGINWTMYRPRALARLRELRTEQPRVLTATVRKADICGLLTERFESEVLVLPADLRDVRECGDAEPEGMCLKPRDRKEWADWVRRLGVSEISRRTGVSPDLVRAAA